MESNFYARIITASRITWDRTPFEGIYSTAGIRENRLRHGVPPGLRIAFQLFDTRPRNAIVSRRETNRSDYPRRPRRICTHAVFPVFCAARWRCGDKWREEREREREVSCFGIKLTRGRACAVDDEWCSRVNIGAHGAERKVGRTNRS